MPTAFRDGIRTYWKSWGEGAPSALMLHCSLAHSGAWEGLARRLGRACIAPDLPGHGRSGPMEPGADYQVQCLDVAQGFLGDAPIDLIGHSFGATVALRLALEQPDRVRRLVLIEPVLFAAAKAAPDYDEHIAVFHPFSEALRAGDPMLAAERFTTIWGTGVSWDRMREDQRQALAEQIHIIPAQDGALFQDNAGIMRPGRLERLQTPVLLIEGARSPAIVARILDALESRLPDARRVRIEGAAHMLPITHPDAVALAISPFLSL